MKLSVSAVNALIYKYKVPSIDYTRYKSLKIDIPKLPDIKIYYVSDSRIRISESVYYYLLNNYMIERIEESEDFVYIYLKLCINVLIYYIFNLLTIHVN